jgi:hypothetical protein
LIFFFNDSYRVITVVPLNTSLPQTPADVVAAGDALIAIGLAIKNSTLAQIETLTAANYVQGNSAGTMQYTVTLGYDLNGW